MDIKKVLSALSEDDRNTWQSCRNALRSAYINAHNNIIGVQDWSIEDDAFLDLIDIKIATLFDRAGRLETTEKIVPSGEAIEKDIEEALKEIKVLIPNPEQITDIKQMNGLSAVAWGDSK